MESIVIRSYNCQSFRRNIDYIKILLNDCDVLFLQETLLPQHAFNLAESLNNGDSKYEYSFVSSTREDDCFVGRSSGGLACIWKKRLSPFIDVIHVTDRIHGLSIKNNKEAILLLNIYCPCDYRNDESRRLFLSTIADLKNVCREQSGNYDHLAVVGDWNADPSKGRFFCELLAFSEELSMDIVDVVELPPCSHTYVSPNESCTTSWLDHVVSSNINKTINVKILYGETFYDHLPIQFECPFHLSLPVGPLIGSVFTRSDSYIPWDKLSEDAIHVYKETLDELSKGIRTEFLFCSVNNCNDEQHKIKLNELYQSLRSSINEASGSLYRLLNGNRNYKSVPGWNLYCKDLHAEARLQYLNWMQNGKPRQGFIFDQMKLSRSNFKRALDYCRNNEARICKQNLANAFSSKSKTNYWREIGKLNGHNRAKQVHKIDNELDSNKIVEIFKSKYKRILDDPASQVSPERYAEAVNDLHMSEQISACDIFRHTMDVAIDKLCVGLGWDGIHSSHLKFSGKEFRSTLCRVFSSFIRHGFVPDSMMRGEIRPILKNPLGDKTSSNNYRPIMNSSNMFKLFEYCIFPFLRRHLKLNSRQFAYRPDVSCMTSGAILKETIVQYNSKKSNIHCLLIDYSKAYDLLNNKILLCKLIKSGLPRDIVRVMRCMFENSFIGIRFQNTCSKSDFKAGNGVRQGGICSGLLFTFYINDILNVISEMNIGCSLANFRVNVLAYADDLSILAPSREALQILINVITRMSHELALTINTEKTQYIVFISNKRARNYDFVVSMNHVRIQRVFSCKYLGVCLSDDLSLDGDIDRCCRAFLGQFNSMFYKFSFVPKDQLIFLFMTYCTSFYGLELWNDGACRMRLFDRLSVSYHKALKRIVGLPPFYNNHDAAKLSGLLLFKHLLASRLVSFLFNLVFNKSDCLSHLRAYFKNESFMAKNIKSLFANVYDVHFLYNNNLCALKSRISYVQRTEPSSRYVPFASV